MIANDNLKIQRLAAKQLVKAPNDVVKEKINDNTTSQPNNC